MQERIRANREARCAEMRCRLGKAKRLRSKLGRLAAQRERLAANGFARMEAYLEASRRELERERYCSAMAGCPTAWPAIEERSKYQLGKVMAHEPGVRWDLGRWALAPRVIKPEEAGA